MHENTMSCTEATVAAAAATVFLLFQKRQALFSFAAEVSEVRSQAPTFLPQLHHPAAPSSSSSTCSCTKLSAAALSALCTAQHGAAFLLL
jgi:hypothetical protein